MERSETGSRFNQSLILVGLGGLVVVHIVPHAVSETGNLAWVGFVAGLVLSGGMHRLSNRGSGRSKTWLTAVALGSVSRHAIVDGMALFVRDVAHAHDGS